jgi:hypothetical protein
VRPHDPAHQTQRTSQRTRRQAGEGTRIYRSGNSDQEHDLPLPTRLLPAMTSVGRGNEGEGKITLQAVEKDRGFRMVTDERINVGIGIAIGIGIVSFFVFSRSCGPSSFPHPGLGTRFLPIPIATPIPMVAVTGDGGVSPPSPSTFVKAPADRSFPPNTGPGKGAAASGEGGERVDALQPWPAGLLPERGRSMVGPCQ